MARSRTKRVTIEEVAEHAEVSVATVSRALRGLAHVAPATRDRVQAAASELGYVADPHASRLAAGRTHTIAMGVPVLNHWYNAQVVAGAEAVLAEEGLDLLLSSIATREARGRFVTQAGQQKRADGVILLDIQLTPDETAQLERAETAVTTIGRRHARFPSLAVDHAEATRSAIEHLIDLGHRRIGLISGLAGGPLEFSVPRERRDAYHRVLDQAGLHHGPELEAIGNFTTAGGREAMAALLAGGHPPTAVYAMSDEMAFGAMMALRDAGMGVPDDMSLVGFDNHDLAEVVELTTVCQRVQDHGAVAARLLLDYLETGRATALTIPTQLVVRSSTAPC